ncbi:hypothetical protein ACIQUQ_31120 [Streptomyces sp. NPDC101118]|uniref:hypothetical protein n=1 Tax=Streptomyces sp. NPDC101118 TaxID=3366109 RepID=UPI0037F92805
MPTGSAAFLFFALSLAVLLSLFVGALAMALVRWEGGTLPAALTRGGVAFGGALTVCCAVIALVVGTGR